MQKYFALVGTVLNVDLVFCRLAIKQLSEIDGWSEEQMKAIIDKAKTVWAETADKWDKDQVNELGKVLSKLHNTCVLNLNCTQSLWRDG